MVSKKMTIEDLSIMMAKGFEKVDERFEKMATKSDLDKMATKSDLEKMAKKSDLDKMAKKSDLDKMATKSDLENLARMVARGFENTAKKSDLDSFKSETYERFEKLENIIERMDREMVKKYDFEHILSGYNSRIIKVEGHLNIK